MCPRSSATHASPTDPRSLAERIAEAVDTTWHRSAAPTSRIEIPLSVAAGLALIRTDPTDAQKPSHNAPAAGLQALPDGVPIAVLRDLWVFYLNQRPDLIARAYPLCSWLFQPEIDPTIRDAAAATARAALDAGQLQLTGTDLRHEVDLLGVVLTTCAQTPPARAKASSTHPPTSPPP